MFIFMARNELGTQLYAANGNSKIFSVYFTAFLKRIKQI
jgi:hypothetical protein